jgi:hypothetical protein
VELALIIVGAWIAVSVTAALLVGLLFAGERRGRAHRSVRGRHGLAVRRQRRQQRQPQRMDDPEQRIDLTDDSSDDRVIELPSEVDHHRRGRHGHRNGRG